MKLVFTNQFANIIIALNGLILLFYFGAKMKNRQRAMKFGNYETLQKVAGKHFLKSSNIVLLIRMLAVTALLVGISSPVLVQEVTSTESDYVIAIDSSASMLNSDIEPTRFQAAKDISRDFVQRLGESSDVGLVSFAGTVKKAASLSSDREKVLSAIENMETGNRAGTAIGDALSTASSMLIDSNRSRTVVLITDGRNNVGSSIGSAVRTAVRNNITIHTFGIGSSNTTEDQYRIIGGKNASKADFPNLNQEKLISASNKTGGTHRVVTRRSELESAFISLEKSQKRTPFRKPLILFGVFLLLLEWVVSVTRYSVIP